MNFNLHPRITNIWRSEQVHEADYVLLTLTIYNWGTKKASLSKQIMRNSRFIATMHHHWYENTAKLPFHPAIIRVYFLGFYVSSIWIGLGFCRQSRAGQRAGPREDLFPLYATRAVQYHCDRIWHRSSLAWRGKQLDFPPIMTTLLYGKL